MGKSSRKPPDIERRYASGECIVERGSTVRELYVIRSGEVRLEGAHDQKPLLLGPGDLFGEAAAILGEPHAYRAQADSEAALLAIDVPLLNRLCAESRDFAFRLIRHLAERAALPEQGAEQTQPPAPDGSLRALVGVILERAGDADGPAPVPATLKELADEAGVSVQVAYRHLQALLDQRVLRLADDELTLIQPDHLRALLT
jgi:CRP-like cAMP-binding protein